MTTKEPKTGATPFGRGTRVPWALAGVWTLVVAAATYAWWQERQREHRIQSTTTAGVRLAGIKDTLALTMRHLAALPLELSHRPDVQAFMAAGGAAGAPELRASLARVGADFDLPAVALFDPRGEPVASSGAVRMPDGGRLPSVAGRKYFSAALERGNAVQFLFGRASRSPGLYFASRVVRDGATLGVAVVKQDADALNRLLGDADGARLFVTDGQGVVVLANRPDMLMHRLPDAADQTEAVWNDIYHAVPARLAWEQRTTIDGARTLLLTRIDAMRHVTLSTPMGDAPFRAWVLEPLDEETAITAHARLAGAAAWLIGCALIWLSGRRLRLIDAAAEARRQTYELTRALPLTVFRYVTPRHGPPRFTFVGRGFEELLGIDAAAFAADPQLPWRLAGSGDRPPTQPHEFRVTRGDGDRAAWVLVDSTPTTEADGATTYNGYWLDITARRALHARFTAVFEHSATGYVFFDAQQGITHCNPAALALFGATETSALVGRILWFPGLSPELQADGRPSRQRAVQHLHEHGRSGEPLNDFEWRFCRLDGSEFDADVSVIALERSRRPPFCALLQDITARKQMQAATEAARANAEAASQTKSSFLANMSHELRTPMNAIIGMTHLALEDGLPDKQRDYVEKAHGAARNLLQILNDILDLSKIEAGQMALERIDFELEAVVADMADVLGLRADEKGLELLFTASADLPRRLVGDPSRLRQVLVNLGSNAIKFTESGEVTVAMDITQQDADSVELHCSVHDTGVGLSEDEIGRLFQPFIQADSSTTRRYGGTGLGLVISRQLVERMGGRLWVESVPGRGSTFHFSARFGRSTPRAPARAWMAAELRGERALLVDDNPAALDVLGSMLAALGVLVDRAGSGAQALELVDAAPQAHTWCLIDWKMPGMDGVECARRILAKYPDTQPCILLVTAFAREDALRAGAGLPLAGVLHKPVTPSTLHDCLVQARRAEPALRLPARRGADPTPRAAAARQRLAGARVLLAEDHPLNQELARELLQRAGMQVVVAGDGQEALAKLAADGPFDGVLMDCQMPVMDGYTATRELRRHAEWAQLPVIAMTASALAEDRERAFASGMNAHITKPIHLEAMLATMAEWISGPAGTADAAGAAALDTATGLMYCNANPALYDRLLDGFRASERDFVAAAGRALDESRPNDALRRAHDLKGLAGTLGAAALQAAATELHAALAARRAEAPRAELARVDAELTRVFAAIDARLPGG